MKLKIRGITTLKKIYGYIKILVKKILFIGTQRYCPICQRQSRKFDVYGVTPRPDALCIHCKSLERHRLVWLFFKANMNLFSSPSKTMLHIAPEPCLEKKLKNILGNGYVTADLYRPDVQVKMDITAIPFADETYDAIYCSHVLEHVPDDRKALREFYRILKPSGWLLLVIPVNVDKTIEDASITDPQKRLKLFGQDDHVRKYGPDIIERIREAGFKVQKILPGDFLSAEQIRKYSTTVYTPLFYCTKQ
jgi:SAM-dependent methyltransferase